jgi:ribonuclease P protein subunit RPP14
VLSQTYRPLELVCFDDKSTDDSFEIIERWKDRLRAAGVKLVVGSSTEAEARGPGFARNHAYALSSGEYICHLDADDIMASTRIEKQLALAISRGRHCLVGSNFNRIPEGSTPYYTDWINGLSDEGLLLEQYRECTLICPTWFMHKDVFMTIQTRLNRVNGAYLEEMPGIRRVPEDTYFFMDHLELGGTLAKVPEVLVTYRYTPGSWCTGTSHADLQVARLPYLQRRVLSLPTWKQFTIWGYGKDGRKFITRLPKEIAAQVVAFCDVDVQKIGMTYFIQSCRKHIPVIKYSDAKPPMIICVASKRAQGGLEENIKRLNMVEGVDYLHFC